MLNKKMTALIFLTSLLMVVSAVRADCPCYSVAKELNCKYRRVPGSYLGVRELENSFVSDIYVFNADGTASWDQSTFIRGEGTWTIIDHHIIATIISVETDGESVSQFIRSTHEIEIVDACTLRVMKRAFTTFSGSEDPICGSSEDAEILSTQFDLRKILPRPSDLITDQG